ncbi:MAG: Asp-tRNA(Asn)/Glu-tRNA(Gln) amidotransferase subunit GatA [bacterium]|nr:Asp-tRNA(Asn)/Glu-tRNA(Gln) amidotransferase subunit GatA [bacterium]
MANIDLASLDIRKAHLAMEKGEFSAVELAQAYLDVISEKNKEINAYLEVYDDVLDQAQKADEMRKAGKATMLTGIPFAIKDNILIKGKKASSASKILEGYTATYDATVIEKLKKEGVVFIGRTNMDEFALGGSTEKSAYGLTRNPHDTDRVPGGTSGGSAAAVASLMSLCALGSDTGGSVRQPASFCGVVGLKPTYGNVSRYGLIAAVSSFDQIGPITRNVSDAEIILSVIHGNDIHDGTTIQEGTYKPERIGKDRPVIGIPAAFLSQGGISKEVIENFHDSVDKLKKMGYVVLDIDLPNASYSLPVYYIINFAEVSSNLARFDGVRYGLHKDGNGGIDDYFATRGTGLGKEVRRRILLGTYVLSSGYYDAYYNRANALRKVIAQDFLNAYQKVDIILMPTAPSPAFKIGEKISDPVAMYLEDIFTVTANLTGMPAMSIPSGFAEIDGKRLPLGIQMTARHGDEKSLFQAGKEFLGEQ